MWAALLWHQNTPQPSFGTRPDPLRTPATAYRWAELPEPSFPLPPYAEYLKGVKIVLDPGHIGQRDPGGDWHRGPTGLREAEVNLHVAQFLREFLEQGGAAVVLTREKDESLDLPDKEDLRQRAEVANRARADLFLSIHHNAAARPEPNFTTLFYHESPEHSRAGICAARYLLEGLSEALRLPAHVPCPILNDRVRYANGLAVLREARVPAVLSEASFHSNPQEEQRLRDPVYNRREAYGLFLGIARWARAGLPRVSLAGISSGRQGREVVVRLDDGLSARGGWGAERVRILPDSVVVRLDGGGVPVALHLPERDVRVWLPDGLQGKHTLLVDFENVFGQHVLHPLIELDLGGP